MIKKYYYIEFDNMMFGVAFYISILLLVDICHGLPVTLSSLKQMSNNIVCIHIQVIL